VVPPPTASLEHNLEAFVGAGTEAAAVEVTTGATVAVTSIVKPTVTHGAVFDREPGHNGNEKARAQ
jgi:hypothetical protein